MTDAPGPAAGAERMVILGRLAAPWGVKGWIRVHSYTDPPAAILSYPVWRLAGPGGGWETIHVLEGRPHGGGRDLVVALEGVSNPEDARRYVSRDVGLPRAELPAPGPGEYYWDDLVGCQVTTVDGVELGVVTHFHDFPAGPVMAVRGPERERWVPLERHLKRVDLDARRVVVDWDPEF
jgi:16S rRNA processing protein RimM